MCYLALKVSGFEPRRVIGMAGILDTARYRHFIAEALGVPSRDVQAMVLGGHGDSMVPLSGYSTVNGVPVSELLPEDRIGEMTERARNGGAEIVGLLKTGSAYYAPSAAAVEMAECVLSDTGRILPCSVYLNGEYGIKDVYCGVPVRLSCRGAEEIIEMALSEEENALLKRSGDTVKQGIAKLSEFGLL